MNEFNQNELEQEAKIQLAKWKAIHRAVYLSEIEDFFFVWKELSRPDFRKALDLYEDDHDRAEYVCQICVLDPIDVDWSDEIYAGIPEVLCDNILKESGFSEGSTKIKDLMAQFDGEMSKFENQISCVIKEAFPEYSIEDIETWGTEKTIWFFSRAKWMLKTLKGIELVEETTT